MKRSKFAFICSGLLAAVLLTGCGILPAEEELPAKPVLKAAYTPNYETVLAVRSDVDTSSEQRVGYRPAGSVDLSFAIDGILYESHVRLGDVVREGQLLASYETEGIEQELAGYEQQLAQYQLQKTHLQENKTLALEKLKVQQDTVKAQLKDADETAAAQLKLQADSLATQRTAVKEQYDTQIQLVQDNITVLDLQIKATEKKLSQSQIVAPMDGMVSKMKYYDPGAAIEAETVLFTLDSLENGIFYCGELVFETGKVYEGTTVSGVRFEAEAYSETGESMTGYLRMRTEGVSLLNGASATIEIPGKIRSDVLHIKAAALHERNDGTCFVYVLENDRAVMRDVKTGDRFGIEVEIIDGLKEGDEVVVK